jgi:hypothetical protein
VVKWLIDVPQFEVAYWRAALRPVGATLALLDGRHKQRDLTYMPISEYDLGVAQAATTADAFNAAAEPRRRQILDALAGGERP